MVYGLGSSGRAERLASSLGGQLAVQTLLLNPTNTDSLADTTFLRLSLEVADDQQNGKPLADWVWYSSSPRVNQITHMTNGPDAEGVIGRLLKFGYQL